jgi:hypothetical protein
MTFKIPNPESNQWSCAQNGDRFAVIVASKNLDLDEEGYAALAPRAVKIYGNTDDADFDTVVAMSYADTRWWAYTEDDVFTFSAGVDGATQDARVNAFSKSSDAIVFNGEQWASRSDSADVTYRENNDWSSFSASTYSGPDVAKPLCEFATTQQVAHGVGPEVRLLSNSHAVDGSNQINLLRNHIVTTIAAQGDRMLVGTRSSNGSAMCALWDGVGTAADAYFPVNAGHVSSICPYRSSFAVLTSLGQILWFNGNGYDQLAALPTYYSGLDWSQNGAEVHVGHRSMVADGDLLYVNVGFGGGAFPNGFADERDAVPDRCPAGVWVYDPAVGLYHRHGPSQARRSILTITAGNVNTTTDVLTVTAAPATGTPVVPALTTAGDWGANVTSGQLYFAINASATTMKLATTRANALAGTAVDLTAALATASLFVFPETDFGQYVSVNKAALVAYRNEDQSAQAWEASRVLFGGKTATPTSLTPASDSLNTAVFVVPNRGYLVTAKVAAQANVDAFPFLYVYFRPLQTAEDRIVVKHRTAEKAGFPIRYASVAWTDGDTFTTTDARFANVAAGHEVEVIAGRAAGCLAHVSSISYSAPTYTVNLTESLPEVAAADVSHVSVDNWAAAEAITTSTATNALGYAKVPLPAQAAHGGFLQLKVELRGADVALRSITARSEPRRAD